MSQVFTVAWETLVSTFPRCLCRKWMEVKLVLCVLEMKTNEVVRDRKVQIGGPFCTVIYRSASPQRGFLLFSWKWAFQSPTVSILCRCDTWIFLRKFYSRSPPPTVNPNKKHSYKLSTTRRPQNHTGQVRALLIQWLLPYSGGVVN